jgi:hypothetical protein
MLSIKTMENGTNRNRARNQKRGVYSDEVDSLIAVGKPRLNG